MLQRTVGLIAMLLLAGCGAGDFNARQVAKDFKGQVDWVRDAFGEKVVSITRDDINAPYPDVPSDPRPLPRTLKQRTDMIDSLKSDQATAGRIQQALGKSDPTSYLTLDGAAPTAAPITLTAETVTLPDGVRDLDSFDPSRAGDWFALGRVDFAEGSAALGDESDEGLRRAAWLVRQAGTLRVEGFSASERVKMGDKGRHEANRWLADLRARKVASQLIAYGAPPRQLLVGAAAEAVRAGGDKVEIIIDY